MKLSALSWSCMHVADSTIPLTPFKLQCQGEGGLAERRQGESSEPEQSQMLPISKQKGPKCHKPCEESQTRDARLCRVSVYTSALKMPVTQYLSTPKVKQISPLTLSILYPQPTNPYLNLSGKRRKVLGLLVILLVLSLPNEKSQVTHIYLPPSQS